MISSQSLINAHEENNRSTTSTTEMNRSVGMCVVRVCACQWKRKTEKKKQQANEQREKNRAQCFFPPRLISSYTYTYTYTHTHALTNTHTHTEIYTDTHKSYLDRSSSLRYLQRKREEKKNRIEGRSDRREPSKDRDRDRQTDMKSNQTR